jgi:predicted nucleotidyltransferase
MVVKSQKNKTGREQYYRYLPPNIPLAAIRRFARRIAERFDPEKIILFGSFAYGTPHEWSDADLLVVMPAREEHTKAARIQLSFERVFPLDLIVRTPKRFRRGLADGDSFLCEIMANGMIVYEKRDSGLGAKSGRRHSSSTPSVGPSRFGPGRRRLPLSTGRGKVS